MKNLSLLGDRANCGLALVGVASCFTFNKL